jgi:hypothetical protein
MCVIAFATERTLPKLEIAAQFCLSGFFSRRGAQFASGVGIRARFILALTSLDQSLAKFRAPEIWLHTKLEYIVSEWALQALSALPQRKEFAHLGVRKLISNHLC